MGKGKKYSLSLVLENGRKIKVNPSIRALAPLGLRPYEEIEHPEYGPVVLQGVGGPVGKHDRNDRIWFQKMDGDYDWIPI
ncbi:hypothetical protein HOD29_02730 [archaeon]|jgi:hypothetical protein|nr:hypothetical protein [archaeon]